MYQQSLIRVLSLLLTAFPVGFAVNVPDNTTTLAATKFTLTYAYPLLAFKKAYLSLSPILGANHLGHARQLSTSTDLYVIRPNVDTVYSTAIYDLSHDDLVIDIPAIPENQYALVSFHDLYGDNFAILGEANITHAGKFCLETRQNKSSKDMTYQSGDSGVPCKATIQSPTTFGFIMIRWLLDDDNINTVHSLQNSTTVKLIPRMLSKSAYDATGNPRIGSVNWNETRLAPAEAALQLLCQIGTENTPGQFAGNSSMDGILTEFGICAARLNSSVIDIEAANTSVLTTVQEAGQDATQYINNGWSVVRSDLAGDFGTNYGLRTEIAGAGYLMLKAPDAVYPSWTNTSVSQPMEGELLRLGANESYVYTFSGKPLLRTLGFWSLTAYDGDGFLIDNLLNVSSLGDRSDITYPSGDAVYGPGSSIERDGAFQLLIQPADIAPPSNWTNNWLPGPSGGGNVTALLRWYSAADRLLNGTYRYPLVTKQQAFRP